jgi:ribonuclease HI
MDAQATLNRLWNLQPRPG